MAGTPPEIPKNPYFFLEANHRSLDRRPPQKGLKMRRKWLVWDRLLAEKRIFGPKPSESWIGKMSHFSGFLPFFGFFGLFGVKFWLQLLKIFLKNEKNRFSFLGRFLVIFDEFFGYFLFCFYKYFNFLYNFLHYFNSFWCFL